MKKYKRNKDRNIIKNINKRKGWNRNELKQNKNSKSEFGLRKKNRYKKLYKKKEKNRNSYCRRKKDK